MTTNERTASRLLARINEMKQTKLRLCDQLEETESKAKEWERTMEAAQEARDRLQLIAQKTQKSLELKMAHVVSNALSAIFPDPYEFRIVFETKRGQTEVSFGLERPDRPGEILSLSAVDDEVGGGVLDIVAFALRIAMHTLTRYRTRATIILDEPFRFLHNSYKELAADLLRTTAEMLELQFIVVTHDDEIAMAGDKLFKVSQVKKGGNRVSVVKATTQ